MNSICKTLFACVGALLALSICCRIANASTYVVFIPLDSPIYTELETLNGLGYLDTYLDEIKPISRVEAARLTLEAARNLSESTHDNELAHNLVRTLQYQLREEIGWLQKGEEDNQPTMFHPLQRAEVQYIFSRGKQREWRYGPLGTPKDANINAYENTPLLPNNDGLPTSPGSNEVARMSGWFGLWGFITGYGEGAIAGPFSRGVSGFQGTDPSRLNMISGAGVVSLGNFAISFGRQEMSWGTGHFAQLSQSNNAPTFVAIRTQSIHPFLMPWFLKYLGQCRYEVFFGQLDDERYYKHPWVDGQIISFKPLPHFEFGLEHTIDFGGQHNNNYGIGGFIGRATAVATGNPKDGNTNSRGGIYLKFYFPWLRNLEVYQEILGEDNLAYEVPGIGRALPFLSVSYQGGFYLARLTPDGRTDMRFEYALLEPNYSVHSDSLYWTYQTQLMGDPMGPNATEVDWQVSRWLDLRDKISADAFYTEQAPTVATNLPYPSTFYPYNMSKEHSAGWALDFLRLPEPISQLGGGSITLRGRAAVEFAQNLNFQSGENTVRFLIMLSCSFTPGWKSWKWK